jgi:hypothetical protein
VSKFAGILLLLFGILPASAADYYIGPEGDDAHPGTASQPLATIARGLEQAAPGDRLLLLPGIYRQNIEIRRSGAPENPIVIQSRSTDPTQYAIIDGGSEPGANLDHHGFRLWDASWITIRNIEFVNCWTDVIALIRSTYISIQGCHFRDTGQHAVSTRDLDTHHILVEDCTWSQDERVWTTWDWEELHHGELAHYNGGFYGGRAGAGSAVIRRNKISYAFNGLRWWLKEAEKGAAQRNIEIYENRFSYCLDNFIEPEVFTANLHIYHNTFDSCPNGVFSIDKVTGGPIFIYGNVGRWSRDGCSKEKPWTIYKFSNYDDRGFLDEPLFLFHNSWDYMAAFGASGEGYYKADDHLRHFNNAYLFQGGKNLGFNGWRGVDCQFDHDLSSAPWPSDIAERGFETHGLVGNPNFVDSENGDYRLSPSSPGVDSGVIIENFTQWYVGQMPDMGAYEGDRLIYGPPFQFQELPGESTYQERPRIVRCFARDKYLAIFFSTDLKPESIAVPNVRLQVGEDAISIEEITFPGPPRAALLTLSQPVLDGAIIDLQLSPLPVGANGTDATLWGADLRVVEIQPEAKLIGEMADLFSSSDAEIPSAIEEGQSALPRDSGLLPDYPNPFNKATLLRYQVASADQVHLDIFDVAGQRVKRLVDGMQKGGSYQVAWDATAEDGTNMATGSYLVRLQVGKFSESHKVTLIK